MWSINAKYKETFQYCFGVFAGWLALVVCLPHRLGIFSTISKGSDKSNADWYNSSQTDSSSRSARNNSMTVLHSFVASSRSHSIPYRDFDRNTVLCKMCSDTTRAITNTNLVIDARYCPALSSSSPCNRSNAWTTTGNDVLNVYSASARLVHRVSQSVRILVRLSIFSM